MTMLCYDGGFGSVCCGYQSMVYSVADGIIIVQAILTKNIKVSNAPPNYAMWESVHNRRYQLGRYAFEIF